MWSRSSAVSISCSVRSIGKNPRSIANPPAGSGGDAAGERRRGMLSEKTRTAIIQLKDPYPPPRSALLPALYMVQEEQGYVSEASMADVADLLRLTAADVKSV